jgi:hypothetical protein
MTWSARFQTGGSPNSVEPAARRNASFMNSPIFLTQRLGPVLLWIERNLRSDLCEDRSSLPDKDGSGRNRQQKEPGPRPAVREH